MAGTRRIHGWTPGLVALLVFAVPALSAASGDSLATRIGEIRRGHGIPGVAVAVLAEGSPDVLVMDGFADPGAGRPVAPDTLFRVSSISKTLLALAALRLVEGGVLELDAPVAPRLPGLPLVNPWRAIRPLTLAILLEHTAGLPEFGFGEVLDQTGRARRPGELLRSNPGKLRVRWRPGERFAYSNRGYAVVAALLEEVTGQDFEDVVAREVFRPLGMAGARYTLPARGDEGLAEGFLAPGGAPIPRKEPFFRSAAGALLSARDLAALTRMFLRRGRGPDGARYLREETLGRMEYPANSAAARAGLRVGCGLGVTSSARRRIQVWGHYGGGYGYQTIFQYLPRERRGYVLMINSSGTRPGFDAVNDLLLGEIQGDVRARPLRPTRMPATRLAALVGEYVPGNPRHPELAFLDLLTGGTTLSSLGDRLRARSLSRPERILVPVGGGRFRFEGDAVASLVALEVEGRVVLAGGGAWMERLAFPWIAAVQGFLALSLLGVLAGLLLPLRAGSRAGAVAAGASLALMGGVWVARGVPVADYGRVTPATLAVFLAGPLHALCTLGAVLLARAEPGAILLRLVVVSHLVASGFLAWSGLLGLRLFG